MASAGLRPMSESMVPSIKAAWIKEPDNKDAGKLDDDPGFPDTQCTTRQQTDASQISLIEDSERGSYFQSTTGSPERQAYHETMQVLEVFRCLVEGIDWLPGLSRDEQLEKLSLAARSTLWAVEQYDLKDA